MADLTLHLFDRGHSVFFWQSHAVSLSVEDYLDNLDLLCLSIVCLIFGIQLLLTFTVLRLNILCRVCLAGNSSSIILKKLWPTFVATFLLNGGLYHVMFLLRCLEFLSLV